MPAFVVLPASPSDLEAVARVQFLACASDHGFPVIFPKGATLTSVAHFVHSYEKDMESDPTCHIMVVKEALSAQVASFAIWHFYPPKSQDEIDQEMMMTEFPLPDDANKELGNKLVHNGIRKRHEVVAAAIGTGKPYACEFLHSLRLIVAWQSNFRKRSGGARHKPKLPETGGCFVAARMGPRASR